MHDLKKIEQFLYDEASLLDNPDLDSWIGLYTEDGTYWMPVAPDQADPINHVSLFYDDRVMMEVRRRNFVHPRAASKDHPVRSSHIIGNVRLQGSRDNGDLVVTSNFQALVFYRNEQRAFGGRYEHHLVPAGDGYKIRHKKVSLINCDAPQKSLTIYL
ncbi:MAG: aromatic-ring-hydroxylating dioxygenase subunit beta [Gammaproteobacteria bacterium]|nr:aromatic-ring-hydroxylating dioxygenase subunit beta [Gammaproteobacteria bacterium]